MKPTAMAMAIWRVYGRFNPPLVAGWVWVPQRKIKGRQTFKLMLPGASE